MDLQLWAASKLGPLDWSLKKHITFFAPLVESLDFMGIEPVTFSRAVPSTRVGRDGLSHVVAVNAPSFNFLAEVARGLWTLTPVGQVLQFSAFNNLSDSNTLIWFEENAPKSTPTDPNPFNSSGVWIGADTLLKYVTKLDKVATPTEIAMIQTVLTEPPAIVEPPIGPTPDPIASGVFVSETPAGTRNGVNTVFTLSQDPNINSILVFCFGVGPLERVAATPGNLQFTLSGTGNRTLTLGLGPLATDYPFAVSYVIN